MKKIQINPIVLFGAIIASFVLGEQTDEIAKFINESIEVLEQYPKTAEKVGPKQYLQYSDMKDNYNYVDLENPESCHQLQILGRIDYELAEKNNGIENAVAHHLRDISAEICIRDSQRVVDEYLETGISIK